MNTLASPEKPTKTKSNEWYTPARYIEAAREVMGGIDLDPASCELANETVKAARYFTKDDDGLKQQWGGRIWLNPPYSYEDMPTGMLSKNRVTSVANQWVQRLIAEYHQGNVTEAILLVKADPKQRWFVQLWEYLICFAYHHVYFNRPSLPPAKHQFGTAFVYLGPHESQFISVFSQFGTVARRVNP